MAGKALVGFIARRLLALGAQLLVISLLAFSLLQLAPGKPEQLVVGLGETTPAQMRAIRSEYNLDKPFLVQYGLWVKHAVQFDFGQSLRTRQPVTNGIRERLPITLFLGLYAFAIALCLGLPLGVIAALKQRRAPDRLIVGSAVFGVSSPAFATGLILLYTLGVLLGWFPIFGAGSGLVDRAWHLTLPSIAVALGALALIVKLTRAGMIDALGQDFIVFARARGVPERRVVLRHALPNAMIPVVTGAALILAYMLTGSILVETTFALPGMGSLLVESIETKDIPMVQGIVMIAATTVILVNLAADLLYMVIDPRIGLDRSYQP